MPAVSHGRSCCRDDASSVAAEIRQVASPGNVADSHQVWAAPISGVAGRLSCYRPVAGRRTTAAGRAACSGRRAGRGGEGTAR